MSSERVEIGIYLVVDPEICHGQLTFKGTRVPVDTVLTFLGMGDTIEQIQEDWPNISREAIAEALRLASLALQERVGARINEPKPADRAAS
jgi:uncharacterized protein (DUF433 family)